MKITKTYNWNRRDFRCDIECEFCGHREKDKIGYDDSNYYNNVVPSFVCINCGDSSNSLKEAGLIPKTTKPIDPEYDPSIVR